MYKRQVLVPKQHKFRGLSWQIKGIARARNQAIAVYNVVKQEAPDRWAKELYFQTEFRAYLCARTKSKALMCTYMVVDATTNQVTSIVRHGRPLIA